MSFQSYEHMENHYNLPNDISSWIDPKIQFVCTEKIHGTNYSFLVENEIVIPCKRTSTLKENDSFMGHQKIFDKYKDEAIKIFQEIKIEYPDTKSIQLFGELFGGCYDGVTEKGHKKIQKDVNYHKENEFMAYDLKINSTCSSFYYDFDKLQILLKKTNIKVVPVIFTGSLQECLKLNPSFVSQVYSYFGLEKIDDSKLVSEGYVIHPLCESENSIQIRNKRLIFKFKSPKFSEVSEPKEKTPSDSKEKNKISGNLLKCYLTTNRYDNVISKLDENEKDKINLLLYEDILTELKDSKTLDENDMKLISNVLPKLINNFLKTNKI